MIRRFAFRLLCAAGLALSVASPGKALAQDDATVEMARQRFHEGVQFYDQRQYEKARLAFLQAYALKPHPAVLLNLAQSELRAGHPDDAANHFSEYLRANPGGNEADETEVGFSAAKSKVSEVTVSVDVAGSDITLDGAEKGTSPLVGPLYVMPGSHTLEAKSGDKHGSKTFTAVAGQSMNASLTLRATAAAPAATPTPLAETPEGTTEPNEALPETQTPPEAAPEPSESAPPPADEGHGRKPFFKWLGSTPLALVTGGLGVGLVGGSVVFALVAHQDYANAHSLEDQINSFWDGAGGSDRTLAVAADPQAKPCAFDAAAASALGLRAAQYQDACNRFKTNSDHGDTFKTLSIVSGIAGGAAIVGTIIYYFADPHAEEEASTTHGFRAQVLPVVAPGTASLAVIGQF